MATVYHRALPDGYDRRLVEDAGAIEAVADEAALAPRHRETLLGAAAHLRQMAKFGRR